MQRLTILSLLLIVVHLCAAQKSSKFLAKFDEPEIQGKVKMIQETMDTIHREEANLKLGSIYRSYYYYNTSRQLDSTISLSVKGFIVKRNFTYDDRGHEIKATTYNNRKGTYRKELQNEYFYNAQGVISKRILHFPKKVKSITLYNEHGDEVEIDEYGVRKSADKTKTDSLEDQITVKNTYGANGLLYEAKYYDADTLLHIVYHKYDTDSNEIEVRVLGSDGNTNYINEYSYNKKGLVIECTGQDGKGNLISHQKYDDYGNPTDFIYYKKNGTIDFHSHTDYEYDKEGNWIKRISLSKKGEKITDIRTIEYY